MRRFGAKRAVATAIIALVSGLLVSGPTVWKTLAAIGPAKAADAYIRALAAGDRKTALARSSGNAAWVAKNLQAEKADVVSLRAFVTELGKGYAEALIYAELKLGDGSRDAGWYRLALVQKGGWKVISAAEHPWVPGAKKIAAKKDVAAAKEVFASYLRLLSENKYAEAAKLLCGPARRAHERGAPALGVAPLFKRVGEIFLTPVWRKGNQMICRVAYEVDERRVDALVRFAKLGDGWHVLGVDQV